ncbi:hypothetical protein FQN54_000563 [Arachnomyces sp. PD_36]|nr:hypothetical protein FQN54_000563 [Arachnomyces sp. PD_36]
MTVTQNHWAVKPPSEIYFSPDDAPEIEIPIKTEVTKTLTPTLSAVAFFKPAPGSKALKPDTTYVLKSYDYDQMVFYDGAPDDPEAWAEESSKKEKRVYDVLRTLQGRTLARCYGTACWVRPDQRKVKALVFEHVGGFVLQDIDTETKKSFGKVIGDNARAAVRPLKEHGILHGDIRLPNFIVRPDFSVVLLDFGSSTPDLWGEEWKRRTAGDDEDMEYLDLALHRREIDVYPPYDPQRFHDEYEGYRLWNIHVETQPATWRERYYRFIEGEDYSKLRWDLKEDVPRDALADTGFY